MLPSIDFRLIAMVYWGIWEDKDREPLGAHGSIKETPLGSILEKPREKTSSQQDPQSTQWMAGPLFKRPLFKLPPVRPAIPR